MADHSASTSSVTEVPYITLRQEETDGGGNSSVDDSGATLSTTTVSVPAATASTTTFADVSYSAVKTVKAAITTENRQRIQRRKIESQQWKRCLLEIQDILDTTMAPPKSAPAKSSAIVAPSVAPLGTPTSTLERSFRSLADTITGDSLSLALFRSPKSSSLPSSPMNVPSKLRQYLEMDADTRAKYIRDHIMSPSVVDHHSSSPSHDSAGQDRPATTPSSKLYKTVTSRFMSSVESRTQLGKEQRKHFDEERTKMAQKIVTNREGCDHKRTALKKSLAEMMRKHREHTQRLNVTSKVAAYRNSGTPSVQPIQGKSQSQSQQQRQSTPKKSGSSSRSRTRSRSRSRSKTRSTGSPRSHSSPLSKSGSKPLHSLKSSSTSSSSATSATSASSSSSLTLSTTPKPTSTARPTSTSSPSSSSSSSLISKSKSKSKSNSSTTSTTSTTSSSSSTSSIAPQSPPNGSVKKSSSRKSKSPQQLQQPQQPQQSSTGESSPQSSQKQVSPTRPPTRHSTSSPALMGGVQDSGSVPVTVTNADGEVIDAKGSSTTSTTSSTSTTSGGGGGGSIPVMSLAGLKNTPITKSKNFLLEIEQKYKFGSGKPGDGLNVAGNGETSPSSISDGGNDVQELRQRRKEEIRRELDARTEAALRDRVAQRGRTAAGGGVGGGSGGGELSATPTMARTLSLEERLQAALKANEQQRKNGGHAHVESAVHAAVDSRLKEEIEKKSKLG